jgi:D-galactarolactone cycloisomerase
VAQTIPGDALRGAAMVAGETAAARITAVETVPVVADLVREFRGSYYRMSKRATVITRLHTDQGVVGEAYVGDEDKALPEIERIIAQEIAPRVIGQDVLSVERLWATCYPVTFDILRDRRIGLVALAAFDTAMWDAVGKLLGQPLWRLWGGYRDSIPMMVIGGYYGRPVEALDEEVAEYREMGLAGMKLKVGGLPPAEDAKRVARVRAAAGEGFLITIDANQGYSVPDAVDLAHRVADLDVTWFEEPVGWGNDRRSLRDVRYICGLPICAGQTETSIGGCRDLMEAGAIDVCNFDASWSGGPTAWLRMAAIAHAYDVRVGHHEEPQVSLHLLASQSHGTYAECFHPDRDPFWWNLVSNRPPLVAGQMALPDDPGLGWELNWDYIDKHRAR